MRATASQSVGDGVIQITAWDAIQLPDVGTIRAADQLPSAALLACSVEVTGP